MRDVKEQASSVKEKIIDENTPWKGKPSTFFIMDIASESLNDAANPKNYHLNDD